MFSFLASAATLRPAASRAWAIAAAKAISSGGEGLVPGEEGKTVGCTRRLFAVPIVGQVYVFLKVLARLTWFRPRDLTPEPWGRAIAAQLIPGQNQDWIFSEMGDTGFEPVTPSV